MRYAIIALVLLLLAPSSFAQIPGMAGTPAPAADPAKVAPAYIWRIESPTPCYLVGASGYPDARVTTIPEIVQRAFDAAAVVMGDTPSDPATQQKVMKRAMLPKDQDLRKMCGDELFKRVITTFMAVLGAGQQVPAGTDKMIGEQFARVKPWILMSQLSMGDYLMELMMGKQALDAKLCQKAGTAGKEVAYLMTLDEKIDVIESFTPEEQVKLLKLTLDEIDAKKAEGTSPGKKRVELYLAGDEAGLLQQMPDSLKSEPAFAPKVVAKLRDGNNSILADRVIAAINARKGKAILFVLGVDDIAGPTGVAALLSQRGAKVARLTDADVAKIGSPAAPAAPGAPSSLPTK